MLPTNSTNTSRWYVVRTKPKQEPRAEANLLAWGLETFAPRVWERQPTRRGCTALGAAPLFPGYLFARFDAATLIGKVRLTRGVHSVVGLGEAATPIDDDVMALIRGRLGEDGFVHVGEPALGDAVSIIDGPLRSLVGVFERHLKGSARVLVLLNTLNAPMHVQVPLSHIRKAEPGGGGCGAAALAT